MEAEYTITRPKQSSRTAAHSRPASYSGICARTLMRAAMGQPLHRSAKHLAAMRVIAEHVEARARGREQHRVAGAGFGGSDVDRLGHAPGAAKAQVQAREPLLDEGSVASDQDDGAGRARQGLAQRRE